MPGIRDIKRRTEGISKILKVTSALEIVAATRLRRAEKNALKFRPYCEAIASVIKSMAERISFESPLTELRAEGRAKAFIVITSDQGLCGGFNYNVVNVLNAVGADKKEIKLLIIGKKGLIYFRNKGYNIVNAYSDVKVDNLKEISEKIRDAGIRLYRDKEVDSVEIIFNRFRRHLLGEAKVLKILPLKREEKEKIVSDYLYEPAPEAVLENLISEYVKVQISSAILESKASEEMARMVAMKYATDNANELISKLMLDYHKMRQAAITKEIIEVVNAAPT